MAKKAKSTDHESTEQAGAEAPASPSSPALPNERLSKLLAGKAIQAISKKFGSQILQVASEHQARIVKTIPTGIWQLDRALNGGWMVGRIHTLFGPKAGGKTTTLLRALANAQQMCSECWTFPQFFDLKTGEVFDDPLCECKKFRETTVAYLDVEGAWHEEWARRVGVKPERLLLTQTDNAEQALDIAEALLRSQDVDVLALDSLAFLTPTKEIEESTAKETMGVQPRVIGKGVRKFVSALNWAGNQGRRPTIFFTNQIRMKLGVMFGNPETTSGGMAPGFSATTEVRFQSGKYEMEPEPKEAPEGFMARPLSVEMAFKVEKLKVSDPRIAGSYRMILHDDGVHKKGQIDDEIAMIATAEDLGALTKASKGWSAFGKEYQTKDAILQELIHDSRAKLAFNKALLRLINPPLV